MNTATEPKKPKIEKLQAAVAASPDSAVAHLRLGTAWLQAGAAHRAETHLQRAVDIDPTCDEAWINLGGIMLARWDFVGCVEVNRMVAERSPKLLLAHFNEGLGHLYLREAKEMVSCFGRVLEIDPNHAAGHYYHAVGLLELGEEEAARAAMDRAVALRHSPAPEFLKALERRHTGGGVCPHGDAANRTGTIEGGQ